MSFKQESCVDYAIRLCGGNASALARLAGCSPQAPAYWKRTGVIPANRVPDLAKKLKTSRAKLNPIFARD
jgi:hypothetical protein|nr:MAG TPA: Putative antitoxin of bacterial toxin-antitoxin system, YdaS/YdaT [Caudoviricetes sp.]